VIDVRVREEQRASSLGSGRTSPDVEAHVERGDLEARLDAADRSRVDDMPCELELDSAVQSDDSS
jgi:hypothetical protein